MTSLDLPIDAVPGRPAIPKWRTVPAMMLVLIGFVVTFFGSAPPSVEASPTLSIYRNALDTPGKRAKILRYGSEGRCKKGKSRTAFSFSLGKQTRECSYRLPVNGRSVQVSAVGFLSATTPSRVAGRTYLGLSTRLSGNGSGYRLFVFPVQKKIQLVKVAADGSVEYLVVRKNIGRIRDPGGSNKIVLRAFNGVKGKPYSTARLVVRINGKRLAVFDDRRGGQLKGRTPAFSIGSTRFAKGASGSFRRIDVRIKDPFA